MANLENSEGVITSHGEILNDMVENNGDFSKCLPRYSNVQEVVISSDARLSQHNLWTILHCVTKMKKVTRVKVDTVWYSNVTSPWKLLEQAGFRRPVSVYAEQSFRYQERYWRMDKESELVCPTLRMISLDEMKEMLEDLPSDMSNIKEIVIFHFDKPCFGEFNKFLTHCGHFESLELVGKGRITDYHLKVIGEHLHKLRRLAINMAGFISDRGIGFLTGEKDESKERCPLLHTLEIIQPQKLTKRSFPKLSSGLPLLRTLNLWADEVDKNALQCIAGMRRLTSVLLRSFDQISAAGFEVMKQAGFDGRHGKNVRFFWGCWNRKTTARKSTARKSIVRKSTARKSTARKSTARKSTARKSTARKTPSSQNSE